MSSIIVAPRAVPTIRAISKSLSFEIWAADSCGGTTAGLEETVSICPLICELSELHNAKEIVIHGEIATM
jgi:hypothetical protein